MQKLTQQNAVMALAKREKEIIATARDLRTRLEQSRTLGLSSQPDTALERLDIDAAFLFRFDLHWYITAARIRGMMRALLGLVGNEPLSDADGKRLVEHFMRNRQLRVEGSVAITDLGYYTSVNPALRPYLSLVQDKHEEWLNEASTTAEVLDSLHQLADEYNLIPHARETNDWGPNMIESLLWRMTACVAYARGTSDLFRWDKVRFVERQRFCTRGPGPTIRPQAWAVRLIPDDAPPVAGEERKPRWQPEPLHYNVIGKRRIRTWTVYYLTRRGCGQQESEQAALDVWEADFQQRIETQRYRGERDRLFDVTISKRIRKRAEN